MLPKKSLNYSFPSLKIQFTIQNVTKTGKMKNYRGHQKASKAKGFAFVSK
tara:strand:+ start:420 stop:569 length:150 start_codon:yes stop_codon:yes gene_type:complete